MFGASARELAVEIWTEVCIGIDQVDLERILEPVLPGLTASRRATGGTGPWLSFATSIVDEEAPRHDRRDEQRRRGYDFCHRTPCRLPDDHQTTSSSRWTRTALSSLLSSFLPALTTASVEAQRARPRPVLAVGGEARTESPARNSPQTPSTPTARTPGPCTHRRAAPASSQRSPRGRSVNAIQCLGRQATRGGYEEGPFVLAAEDAEATVPRRVGAITTCGAGERGPTRGFHLARQYRPCRRRSSSRERAARLRPQRRE